MKDKYLYNGYSISVLRQTTFNFTLVTRYPNISEYSPMESYCARRPVRKTCVLLPDSQFSSVSGEVSRKSVRQATATGRQKQTEASKEK